MKVQVEEPEVAARNVYNAAAMYLVCFCVSVFFWVRDSGGGVKSLVPAARPRTLYRQLNCQLHLQ